MSRSVVAVIVVALILLSGSVETLFAQQPGRYGHYEVYDPDLLPLTEYAHRRSALLSKLDDESALLVRSRSAVVRSNDVDYEYRQRNNLLYLTGVTEKGSALLLTGSPIELMGQRAETVLFVSSRNPEAEIWTGITMGPEQAARITGIPVVVPYTMMRQVLDTLMPSLKELYYDGWEHQVEVEPLTGSTLMWDRQMRKELREQYPGLRVLDAGDLIHPMRQIKSKAEIEQLRRAVRISMEAHRETIRQAEPGMHEYELEAIMEYNFMKRGAEAPGYPSIVGSGPNTCILHYESSRRRTEPGDLVLMDCGAEYHGYTADITRTFPVSGTFSPEQRTIYDLVLRAQDSAFTECRTGSHFFAPHRKAIDVIADGLVELGIISEPSEYARHFMHGTSHFLGLDVHDVGTMGVLKEGMVITVEPGIYIPADSDCDPKWWNIGIRIEDDVLITDDGPVNLSEGLERTAAEIEALMREDADS